MKITIAGIGNAGTTIGADLAKKGHQVTLLKTSRRLHNDNYEFLAKNHEIHVKDIDCSYKVKIENVTDNMKEAIRGAELIIIYVQTNYHFDLIKRMEPYFEDGQVVLIEPGYLSTCYFMQYVKKDLTIIEAESSPIDCRITEPGYVQVLFKNVLNPYGVYPQKNQDKAEVVLKELGYPFMITKNVAEAALHNPNLIVHTIGAIFSIPRIEYTGGDYWMYKEVFTPHVWNVVEALDNEKMNILEKLGCERLPYVEACKLRNSINKNENALDVFRDYANNGSPYGPNIPDSRYITEDVPEGLVMLESLGKVLNIETPTTTGLINCASAALKINFRESGRTVEKLGIENIKLVLAE